MQNPTENIKLLNIVAFALLMENGEGLMSKSPNYVLEKFNKYALSDEIAFMWGLDHANSQRLRLWADKWGLASIPEEKKDEL